MTSACRGGHGGETRRVKVGGGCGPQRGVGVCRESLGPRRPSTPPHTPSRGGISGLKDNEWKRCNVRPTAGGGNGWPGARCSDAARRDATLLPEAWCDPSSKLFLSPSPPFFDIYCVFISLTRACALLMPEADEATDRHTCSCLARPDCRELPIHGGPSSARRGSYGHSPRPCKALGLRWGCPHQPWPLPQAWHDGAKIQKSGMWSPETTSIPGISVTGSRRRLCAAAPWTTPCTLARCLSSGPNFRPACLPTMLTYWTQSLSNASTRDRVAEA